MNKKVRRFLIIATIIIFIGIIIWIASNLILKNKVENFLATRMPDNITTSYDDLSLNIFEGTLSSNNLKVAIRNSQNSDIHTKVKIDTFIIEDISYWDYLFNDEIHIEDIKIKRADIHYFKHKLVTSKDSVNQGSIKLFKPVLIDELSIDNTTMHIYDGTKDSVALYGKNVTVEIDDIYVDRETLKKRLPIKFSEYEAKGDSVYLKVGAYEELSVSEFSIKKGTGVFNRIELKTKYSKATLSQIIPKERDHYNVTIPNLSLDNLDFGFKDRGFYAKSNLITIKQPTAAIFRDKTVADDPTPKKLYSEMLRKLPIRLTIDSLNINQGRIAYTEKVNTDNTGGTITFEDLNAKLKNISNTYESPIKTEVNVFARFMNSAPINVQWNFDVNNINDAFVLKADIGQLQVSEMNQFTKPNLKIMMEGEVYKTYFTISGNHTNSHIDMKMKYDNFKISLLNSEGDKKKKFLSGIVNLFISKDSDKSAEDFRSGSANVTRDKSKSIFNYFWLNASAALKEVITGGKDE